MEGSEVGGRQNNSAPARLYARLHGKGVADVIKIANQLTLSWEINLVCPDGLNETIRVLVSGKGRQKRGN